MVNMLDCWTTLRRRLVIDHDDGASWYSGTLGIIFRFGLVGLRLLLDSSLSLLFELPERLVARWVRVLVNALQVTQGHVCVHLRGPKTLVAEEGL